jgi:hypothetical protein
MNAVLALAAPPPLLAPDSHWREWVTYGLRWAAARPPIATQHHPPPDHGGRFMTLHAYRSRTRAPLAGVVRRAWPAYRSWYTREGLAARASLRECRDALTRYLPELVPTWERLCILSRDDSVAARMLSMWRLPAFAVGCSQVVLPGEQPALVRNYDYDQALFEAVIASTDYSGRRRVLGTSDMLWGLLDGMNEDGLAVSLTFGGRPDVGEGFGIPIVLRYVLETCATVEQAVSALRRIPVSQSYNVALVDSAGAHATVFVAPGQAAEDRETHTTTTHGSIRSSIPPTRLDSTVSDDWPDWMNCEPAIHQAGNWSRQCWRPRYATISSRSASARCTRPNTSPRPG